MLNDYTVIDFETTGLDSAKDKIIEIGALRVIDGNTVHKVSVVVNPGVEIPAKITELTGLTTEDVKLGLPPFYALRFLKEVIGNSLIVAHNASFDLAFLQAGYSRFCYGEITNNFLCTKTLAAFHFPNSKGHSLEALCKAFSICQSEAHRAINDVLATNELLLKMFSFGKDLQESINVLGHYHKYGPPAWIPDYATVKTY